MPSDPIQTILSRVQRVKRTGPRQWQACCPAHDDQHASLSIGQGDDGRVLIDCKAGCPTLEVLKAVDLKFADLYALPPAPGRPASDDAPKGRIVSTYDYRDEGGTLLFQVVRFDPKDFRQSYALWPTNAVRPDRFSVPGITAAAHASEYARLTWQRSQSQRKRIRFDTELEGLILQLGDRIGVSHNVPKWGDGGLVIGRSGNILTVDHDLDWSPGSKAMLLRAPDGSVSSAITVTRGARDNLVVLPSSPPVTINTDNDFEYTSFAFGPSATVVQDFIVISTTPTGENTVTVEAVNYAPSIYTGAMSYMD